LQHFMDTHNGTKNLLSILGAPQTFLKRAADENVDTRELSLGALLTLVKGGEASTTRAVQALNRVGAQAAIEARLKAIARDIKADKEDEELYGVEKDMLLELSKLL